MHEFPGVPPCSAYCRTRTTALLLAYCLAWLAALLGLSVIAAAGIPMWMIKSIGHWTSNAYCAINELMSVTDAACQPPWDANGQPTVYQPTTFH